jgi:hypothetical protein
VGRLLVLGGSVGVAVDFNQPVPSGKSQPLCCLPALFYPFFAFCTIGPSPSLDNQGRTLVDLYQHYQTATNTIPPDDGIRETLVLVDCRNTAVEGNRVSFRYPGMAMTLDGIAKGYIVDEGGDVLKQYGFGDVLVEAG